MPLMVTVKSDNCGPQPDKKGYSLIRIFVDADGCPVKNEVFRVALRYGFKVYVVSNSRMRIPPDRLFELVIVNEDADAADDWIVEHIKQDDIAVSADIPLAARCLEKGARVLDPKGRIFTEDFSGLFQRLKLAPAPWHFLYAGRPFIGFQVQHNPIRVIKYCHLGLYPGKKSGLRFISRRLLRS